MPRQVVAVAFHFVPPGPPPRYRMPPEG